MTSVSSSLSVKTRYLPRRSMASMRRPAMRAASSSGDGKTMWRDQALRMPTMVRPTSGRRSARTKVSTSGNSGMGQL